MRRPQVSLLARRTAVGLAAAVACALALAWRVRTIAHEPRVALAPRVAQLMYGRMLAQRVFDYARRYGRPAYYLDSVEAHLDSAERQLVADLRTDLWGEPIHYLWNYCWFTISSRAGTPPGGAPPVPPESIPPGRRFFEVGPVDEDFPWPRGVGRTERCFGGS